MYSILISTAMLYLTYKSIYLLEYICGKLYNIIQYI